MRRIIFVVLVMVAAATGFWLVARKPPPEPIPVDRPRAYPLVAMYSNQRTSGEPFVIDGAHGGTAIDSAKCQEQARWGTYILDPEIRDVPGRKAQRYIRALNPAATMLAYFYAGEFFVCGPGWYGQVPPPYGCDTTQVNWAEYRIAERHHAILFDKAGNLLSMTGGVLIDYAQPGVAQDMADLFMTWVNGSGAQGAFTDGPCISIAGWYPGNQTDWHRQGFSSLEDWDRHYQAGVHDFHRLLQQRVGLVVGNCGPHGPLVANGWTGENHPHQNPGSWAAWDTLLARADTAYAAPQQSFITAPRRRWQGPDGAWHVAPFEDQDVQRTLRFVLASASLHNHVAGVLVGSEFDPLRGFMPDQWADEYSVTPGGVASLDASWLGWLGEPAWTVKAKGAVLRYFTGGVVIANPTDSPVTLAAGEGYYRITGTSAANNGTAAATVTVPAHDGLFLARRR